MPQTSPINSNNSDLPQRWSECELRCCVDVLDNLRVPVNSDERAKRQGGVPYYGATGQVGWIDGSLFDEELLLIGEDGAPFFDKSKQIAYIISGRSWVNNHAHVLRAKSRVTTNQFLKYFFDWFDFHDYVNGTTRLKLTQGSMNGIPVRLPPLPEQRRIVAKLEKLLAKVDACQKRLAKIPILLKRFRQSILAAACSGRLTADWREENECDDDAAGLLDRMKLERRKRCLAENEQRKYREAEPVEEEDLPPAPETWRWTNFDHCTWEITVGHVGPMKDRYVEKGVAFLRCQNVRPLRFDTNGLVHIPADFHSQLSKSELLGGEILVVRSGANTGDCCVFPRNLGDANCSDLVITRPLSGLSPEYGALYVNSPLGQALLTLNETGIAQPHFNIGAMRVKAFPLAPLAEQHEIVRRVESLFALADQIEARYAKAQARVDKLTPSLLAKAFRGELVPQDPNDEPASVLLKRIKDEEQLRETTTRLRLTSARQDGH